MNTKQIQKNIMRRVYYAYALRLAVNRLTVHTLLAGVALFIMTQFVHFAAVFQNFSQVPVANVDNFVMSALTHTEAWTLLTLAAFGAVCVSYLRALVVGSTHATVRATA